MSTRGLTASQEAFTRQAYAAANEAGLTGVQADLAVAQAIHESAWGTKPSGKNNFHGIKGKTGTSVKTHEVEQGISRPVRATFRNFASMTDSFKAWANVVGRKWSKAMSAPTLVEALKALRPGKPGGYATDPNYVSKVTSIANRVANVGPGPWGAAELAPGYAADLAQNYAAAGNRRAYEQGFRPAAAATPLSAFSPQQGPPMSAMERPQQGPPISAMQRPQQGPPMSAMQSPTISNMLSGMDSPVYGPGQVTPAAAPQAAPRQARVGPAPSAAPARTPSPDTRYAGPQNVVANTPMASGMTQARMETPNAGFTGTLTPGLLGEKYARAVAPAPQRTAPTPTPRPDYTAPTTQTPAPAPATVAPAAVSAYPEEGRFSMKKGLTPADQVQMGLTPVPAFTKPPTEVATPKVAAVQPVREQVVKTKTVTPHPAIAPGTPLPEKPGGFIANLENLVGPYAGPLAKFALTSALGPVGALATLPFSKTLQNLAGPVPNPPSRNIGTGSQAMSSVLSGQAQAGDTAYSASMPGYSVRDLGNGMVEKTNQFGHVSYEKVDKGGGIFSSKPGGLYSSNPAGVLSGFGLGGVPSSLGGMLSARNLGSFAGGLIGGLPGAAVGGLLGNMISNKTGTAPAASGGGLFGGFGGGFGFGGGGTSASSGDKRGGGKSSGGGATGQSHSTRL